MDILHLQVEVGYVFMELNKVSSEWTLWILISFDSFLAIRQRCFEDGKKDSRASANLKQRAIIYAIPL